MRTLELGMKSGLEGEVKGRLPPGPGIQEALMSRVGGKVDGGCARPGVG